MFRIYSVEELISRNYSWWRLPGSIEYENLFGDGYDRDYILDENKFYGDKLIELNRKIITIGCQDQSVNNDDYIAREYIECWIPNRLTKKMFERADSENIACIFSSVDCNEKFKEIVVNSRVEVTVLRKSGISMTNVFQDDYNFHSSDLIARIPVERPVHADIEEMILQNLQRVTFINPVFEDKTNTFIDTIFRLINE